jgi:hypothetical protein
MLKSIMMFALAAGAVRAVAAPDDLTPVIQRLDRLEAELATLKEQPSPAAAAVEPPAIWWAADPSQSLTFLGPAASKAYFAPPTTAATSPAPAVTPGLVSEFFTYQQRGGATAGGSTNDRTNVLSLSPLLAIRLHHRLIFNSQILFENGGAESSDTVSVRKGQAVVQTAYLDWLADDRHDAGLRLGHQLVPVGWVNTLNEPATYFGVLKPELERELIPSSWHENGLSLWVDRPRAVIEAGVFSSLDSSGMRGDSFLAGGRSQGQNSKSGELMGVFRANVRGERMLLGGSLAFGDTGQGRANVGAAGFQLGEMHARFKTERFEAFFMMAQAHLDDAQAVSLQNSTVMGELAKGYYAQLAMDILAGLGGHAGRLWAFMRYSHYNLHDRVPESMTIDPSLSKTVQTIGFNYFPLPTLVLKADFASERDAGGATRDALSLGTGLTF